MSKRKTKEEFGWFRRGGFEKDVFLTEKDKKYYRKELKAEKKRNRKEQWL